MEDQEIGQLLSLARDKSDAGRERLINTVSDLFMEDEKTLTERERALMTDILNQLIREVEMAVRRHLSERLSVLPNAPRELILTLANDAIEVARPILLNSEILHDTDLIEIIQHRTMEHQLAVAMRKDISETVSDALVETNSVDVIKTLLENVDAKISSSTKEYLVEESQKVNVYREPLIRRPDLGPALAEKMYWWVSAALRQEISAKFDIDVTALDDQIESTVRDILESEGEKAPQAQKKPDSAERLVKDIDVTPELLVRVLRQGEVSLFAALFAKYTELSGKLVRRLLFEPGGEGMAIACKAKDLPKQIFASIFLLSRKARPGENVVDPGELSRILAFYERIDPEAAQKVTKQWQRDPEYLYAIKRLDLAKGGPEEE
ncbi:MAG: DUF2336 domain-containing protein [Alphaproteobacteria bacterium]|nr:DUF2336 domain-containing protein [Alphaproteobacteria bacterium]